MRKRYLILLAGLGVFMTFFLNACSLAEKAAETVSEDKMFIIMIAVIVAVILGVSLGVGIPLRVRRKRSIKNGWNSSPNMKTVLPEEQGSIKEKNNPQFKGIG